MLHFAAFTCCRQNGQRQQRHNLGNIAGCPDAACRPSTAVAEHKPTIGHACPGDPAAGRQWQPETVPAPPSPPHARKKTMRTHSSLRQSDGYQVPFSSPQSPYQEHVTSRMQLFASCRPVRYYATVQRCTSSHTNAAPCGPDHNPVAITHAPICSVPCTRACARPVRARSMHVLRACPGCVA